MKFEGKPVVDAKRPLILEVTNKDIQRGRKRRPDCCAIAQACMRQQNADEARVYLSRTYISKGNKWVRYYTPPTLRTEIVAFDRGHRFEPDTYTLSPMRPAQRVTGTRQGTAPKTPPKRGTKRKYHIVQGVRSRASGWETAAAA